MIFRKKVSHLIVSSSFQYKVRSLISTLGISSSGCIIVLKDETLMTYSNSIQRYPPMSYYQV